ncbi:MAG: ACP S-malonyltransferase [Planctomycetota bacterium]
MDASAFLLCPGRGSYGTEELGTLARFVTEGGERARDLVQRLEELRAEQDPELPGLHELDSAEKFQPSLHLAGQNAAALILACTLADAMLRQEECEPVLVGGNSLGFYSALVVSGALPIEAGFRLVSTVARLQEDGPRGGQLLWTLIDEDWRVVAERVALLEEILSEQDEDSARRIGVSIRLGGHVALAGDEESLGQLAKQLPAVRLGKRDFPFRLPFHGPFHTALLEPVSRAAKEELQDLEIRPPSIPLVDGRGQVWSPLWTDPLELLDYTLGHQITRTFDFTATVRAGILDFAPSELRCLGPGSSLRAPVGHVEKWLDRGWSFPEVPIAHVP